MLQNPYHSESTFGSEQPSNVPVVQFDKPTSDLGKQAVALHKAAQAGDIASP